MTHFCMCRVPNCQCFALVNTYGEVCAECSKEGHIAFGRAGATEPHQASLHLKHTDATTERAAS